MISMIEKQGQYVIVSDAEAEVYSFLTCQPNSHLRLLCNVALPGFRPNSRQQLIEILTKFIMRQNGN